MPGKRWSTWCKRVSRFSRTSGNVFRYEYVFRRRHSFIINPSSGSIFGSHLIIYLNCTFFREERVYLEKLDTQEQKEPRWELLLSVALKCLLVYRSFVLTGTRNCNCTTKSFSAQQIGFAFSLINRLFRYQGLPGEKGSRGRFGARGDMVSNGCYLTIFE